MKRFLIWLGVILSCSTCIWAWNPSDGALVFTPDTRTLTISTTPASPTQILTRDSYIARTWIVNPSTCSVFLSSSSASASTSNFKIYGTTATTGATYFTPDGVNTPWWGAMWAFSSCGGTPPEISIFRTK